MICFLDMYKLLEEKGPGRATSSKGTIYRIEALNDKIIAFPKIGKITIHNDCWGNSHTCQGTRAGGIYNGPYSIFDWYNEMISNQEVVVKNTYYNTIMQEESKNEKEGVNMNYLQFSKNEIVKDFVSWIEALLKEGGFEYSYQTKKPQKDYTFKSIYSAFEKYSWKNKSFCDNQILLNSFKENLIDGLNSKKHKLVQQACINILDWGGVKRGNEKKIIAIGVKIIEKMNNVKKSIVIKKCDVENIDYSDIFCNAGFSKIYSMLIDDFIIYDSRVSSALCLFIRLFAEEKELKEIPNVLKLAFSEGKGHTNRKPNKGKYKFRRLSSDNYLKYNIIASWLLKLIIEGTKSEFNNLPEKIQLRALESALFMIGYEIKEPDKIKK